MKEDRSDKRSHRRDFVSGRAALSTSSLETRCMPYNVERDTFSGVGFGVSLGFRVWGLGSES